MEKLVDNDEMVMYRLQCACYEPECARDFGMELEQFKPQLVIYGAYVTGWRSWREKLVDIWRIATGKRYLADSLVFREEDLRPVGEFFLKVASDWEKWELEHPRAAGKKSIQ